MNDFTIHDVNNFVQPIKLYHPDDPRYFNYWLSEKKKIIEGLWSYDERGWRYMPPKLYFFGNHGWITIVDEKQNVTVGARPELWDLMWIYGYESFESLGFSGFQDDERYTSNKNIFEYVKGATNRFPTDNLFKSNGTLKEYVDPREYMYNLHTDPMGVPLYENAPQNYLIGGSRGGGKEQPDYEIVITPTGEKQIGDLKLGDTVYGKDGRETKVVGIYPQGVKDIYEVVLSDGRRVECGLEHLWEVQNSSGKTFVKTTEELMKKFKRPHTKSGYTYKYAIAQTKPVIFSEKNLPIDPYILGCMLGNGTTTTLTPKIATSDPEMVETFRQKLVNYEIVYDKSTNNNYTIVYRGTDKYSSDTAYRNSKYGHNPLGRDLQALDVNCTAEFKFIPDIYKHSSIEQRLELVRGLMDTDGSIFTSGVMEYDSVSKQLVEDLAYVLRSLGIRCQLGCYDKKTSLIKGTVYNVKPLWRLYINTNLPIFKLSRKLGRLKSSAPNKVSIVDIQKKGKTSQRCIMVDNEDHTYLTRDFIVTHNSFFLGIAEALHEIVTDGVKYYTPENIKSPPTIKVVIGSGDTSKSSELVSKIKDSMDAFASRPELGAWGDISDEDYEPSPFYKNMVGDLTPNNIDNPWRHEYKALVKGREITKGTKTRLHHVSYSEMKGKKKGGQAAAGTRTTLSIIEEGGLTTLLEDAYKSNDATIRIGTRYFGRMVVAGTSENIEVVQPFKTLFSKPQEYRILTHEDIYENTGNKIALFLPCYLTDRTFKDTNGNTNVDSAVDFYKKIRDEKGKAEDPDLLRKEKMNYPLVPSEMWLTSRGSFLPTEELTLQEKRLLQNNSYQENETCVKLIWDSTMPNGVKYEVDHNGEPYRSFPHDASKMKNPEGCVVIYDFPQTLNGSIPSDLYFAIGHDPHADGKEPGSSVASTYILMNPKYAGAPYYLKGNTIVASYNGKPKGGLDEYYEIQEKLISFYGNPPMSIMYEKNKGDACRAHYIKKHKIHLLSPTPQFGQGASLAYKNVTTTGYFTSGTGDLGKSNMIKYINDWLLQSTEHQDGLKQNWERLPCLYLIRQMIQYDLSGNFDAVDGFRGCILKLREEEIKAQSENKKKNEKTTTYTSLLNNNRIFQQRRNGRQEK